MTNEVYRIYQLQNDIAIMTKAADAVGRQMPISHEAFLKCVFALQAKLNLMKERQMREDKWHKAREWIEAIEVEGGDEAEAAVVSYIKYLESQKEGANETN